MRAEARPGAGDLARDLLHLGRVDLRLALDPLVGVTGRVVLGELLTDRINGLLSSGFIELNVVGSRPGWNCTNAEPLYTRRRRAGKLQDSERIDIVSAPVNEKGKLVWRAVHDRDEGKAAGLVAERG